MSISNTRLGRLNVGATVAGEAAAAFTFGSRQPVPDLPRSRLRFPLASAMSLCLLSNSPGSSASSPRLCLRLSRISPRGRLPAVTSDDEEMILAFRSNGFNVASDEATSAIPISTVLQMPRSVKL